MFLSRWLRRRRQEREVRKLLDQVFQSPELLKKTSLRPRHKARWILVDYQFQGDRPVKIWFGILRHPRPYKFSRQSHQVIEYYLYDIETSRITVLKGLNITRSRGRDAD